MQWLKRLFGGQRDFVGEFIQTSDELLGLAASNEIVAAELNQFENKVSAVSPLGFTGDSENDEKVKALRESMYPSLEKA